MKRSKQLRREKIIKLLLTKLKSGDTYDAEAMCIILFLAREWKIDVEPLISAEIPVVPPGLLHPHLNQTKTCSVSTAASASEADFETPKKKITPPV